MLRNAIPWVSVPNNKAVDLYFELLDPESIQNLYKDLRDGHTINVPNFGGRIINIPKTLRWDDLDELDKQKIKNLLKAKPKSPQMGYDEITHSFYKLDRAPALVHAFLKKAQGYDRDEMKPKLINKDQEKKASGKPSFFKSTNYRLPNKEELEEINSFDLPTDNLVGGFSYAIVGRGLLWQKQKDEIVKSIEMLCDLDPENKKYKEALQKANDIEITSIKSASVKNRRKTSQMVSAKSVVSSYREILAAREFSCITAPFPWEIAEKIRQWGVANIREEDLINDGREPDVHVTVKYGLHDHDPFTVRPIVRGFGPIKIILGDTSIFENDKEDVVKISVTSDKLIKLNKLVSDNLEHTNTHPDYIPHVTLAYVKPGTGKAYAGRTDFSGIEVVLPEILFSGNDYREMVFSL